MITMTGASALLQALDSGEVHAWTADVNAMVSRGFDLDAPSPDEWDRAARMHDLVRPRWLACRVALRQVLARYCAIPSEQIRFSYGPYGKPQIAGPVPRVQFSLSHSKGLALISVAGHPVGADLEQVRPLNVRELADWFLSDQEHAQVLGETGQARLALFFRCWTRKEAYLKAVGLGLSGSLTEFDVDLHPDAERALVAHRGDDREPDRWTLLTPPTRPTYVSAIVVSGRPRRLRSFALTSWSVASPVGPEKDQ